MKAFRDAVKSLARFLRHVGRGALGSDPASEPGLCRSTLSNRESLIRRILSTIHNNSILLIGDPGIGKTSVLLELRDRLRNADNWEYEFFPVYIDLRHVPERLLFAAVADAILRQLSQISAPRHIHRAAPYQVSYDHRDLANNVRQVISTLRQNTPKEIKLVLLVDGIDEVNTYDSRTAQKVRSLFMAGFSDNLVMVASAVEIDKRWEQEGSPWFNFFEEIELHDIEGDDEPRTEVRDTMTRYE